MPKYSNTQQREKSKTQQRDNAGELLTLAQVAALLGSGNVIPSTQTVWRWSREGLRGHVLETRRVGGRLFVPRRAVREFAEAIAAG